jgi:hypothetical protein
MGFFSRRRREAARQAVLAELNHGEEILAEGSARFMFTDGVQRIWPDVHLVVTEERLLWALLKSPQSGVPSIRFKLVAGYSQSDSGDRIVLTEHDPEYAAMLQDPGNPYGATDAFFEFDLTPEASRLREVIASRARR